tara:strand:+ start:337 stop:672 length:336 start_codon:yes stop_codon:yes gene_type:complete
MQNVCNDILIYIAYKLKLKDVLHFSCVNKEIYKLFDNIFYKNLAYIYYGKHFWLLAEKRPQHLSLPLGNMKYELMRIAKFQNKLERNKINLWSTKDFYDYWRLEKMFINKK